jgi:hypothetical protein
MAAATALGQFRTDAVKAIPSLMELVKKKEDKQLSMTALMAIKSIRGAKK